MSNCPHNIEDKDGQQVKSGASLSLKMQRSFKKVRRSIQKMTGDPARYTQIVFNTFDRDGDGIVSFQDLVTEIALITNGNLDQKLSWIFSFYDLNGDGYITRKEMLVIISATYEMLHNSKVAQRVVDKHVDMVFKKMDIDKDGVISREEFMNSCKNDSVIQSQLALFDHFW
ncbi:Kv channel-interacting protein 2-like isoform X4 [Colletes gigas]|uniref:Kv channel-interacting protein 2-like isoform X4 n=1 Tax=Colletes gigas TaxID=935657 RepID=UPI001C9B544A|nr:Kv channel-interacting protein 2-like isoform X4 [Colletes gigas]